MRPIADAARPRSRCPARSAPRRPVAGDARQRAGHQGGDGDGKRAKRDSCEDVRLPRALAPSTRPDRRVRPVARLSIEVGSAHASFDSPPRRPGCLPVGRRRGRRAARRARPKPARKAGEAAAEGGQAQPGPEGGRRLPGDGDGPAARRCRPAPALADWAAATDVTPEHVAQRTGADKALAALVGSTTRDRQDQGAAQEREAAGRPDRPPAPQAAARRRREPRDDPGGGRQARRAGDASSRRSSTATPSACSRRAPAARKPITANDIDDVLKKSRDLDERQRIWTVSKEIGRPLKPGLDRAASSCATRSRARWATTRSSRSRSPTTA